MDEFHLVEAATDFCFGGPLLTLARMQAQETEAR
jgi:hypothetical protein